MAESKSMDNILEWLLLLHYRRPHETSKAIQKLNQYSTDFTINVSTYEYDNEHREELLFIRINIDISSIKKSVPVRIWLPQQFPLEHPVAEIIETGSMLMNPSGNVDENNQIRHRYIEEWTEDSNFATFIQKLRRDFTDYFPVFDFTYFHHWTLALFSVEETLRNFPELIPSWQMQTSTNIETSVLQLIGPLHMAGQWSVNVRILLASDFPTEAPDICLMSDDRMNPIMTNIIDNNAKVVDTYIDNWHHPENSLCELLRCIVKEFRGECPKKEQSAASHTSSQDRTPRSERMQRTNELPLFTPQTMPKPARVSKPKSSLSCSNRSKPPRPAPRRINSQKVEIRGFIQNANLSKDIEYQLIKNGFTSPMAILCLHDVDVDKLELSLADLYLLKESLTKLRLDRYESYTNTNKPDTVVTDTGERSHGTTTTTTTTSNLFCRGLRRFLDPLIVKEQQLDLGVQLGTGSCGVVYKGWLKQNDASEREAVAVKTIIVSSVNEEQVEKFIAEILQMSTLKHKNVLELKALTVIDEIPHLVLPFMSNGDLLKYVKYPQKNMTVEDLLMLTLDVAHGMKYLNERQIVHCDLAARNCLVDANYNVKVSDFGMAQQLHKSDYIKLPDSKIAIRWMAPEIFKEGKFSIQSDVWSYGILFWEVLTRGKRPYEEISNTNLVPKRIMEGYVMSFPDWVPEKVQQIIAECWQMEAERRPSFSDIISGLNEALLSDTDTATGAAGILAVPKRPVPRFPDGLQPPAPPALHKQSPPVPPKRK